MKTPSRDLINVVVLMLIMIILHACSRERDNDNSDGNNNGSNFHPAGYAAATAHGLDMNQGTLTCTNCHGQELEGQGDAVSCDLCHTPTDPLAWRTDCTFCHGGIENATGAPPENIDGSLTSAENAFPPHDQHVATNLTSNVSCGQCHQNVAHVLSDGHVLDGSNGIAEVNFANGVSPQGEFNRQTGCANTYCHGGGRADDGSVAVDAGPMTCSSCHAGSAADPDAVLDAMSGFHRLHVKDAGDPATCSECHNTTTANNTSIASATLHINGLKDVAITEAGFTYDANSTSCNGTCHGVNHANFSWVPSAGGFHPANYALPSAHGVDMVLQRSDCRGCHGADLSGGTGNSCDQCHDVNDPTAWRSDCTFCHGGIETATGAPPHDLGVPDDVVGSSFAAHTAHVSDGISSALPCTACHRAVSDVLSIGHAFDATPGDAEVDMSQSLSSVATYENGQCSNSYCHGTGRTNGSVNAGDVLNCSSCHAFLNSGDAALRAMSGDHRLHISDGITCAECHSAVTVNDTTIANTALHVDGMNQVNFEENTITYNPENNSCTGPCHGENHNGFRW